MRKSVFIFFAFLLGVCPCGIAQDVVSASSGVLQYFEGAVQLDDHGVEHKAAVFPSLKNGSVLRTGKGRAELLLTPGVYLRLDEDTSVRLLSNSLVDTRMEVVRGGVLLDNLNAPSSDVVTLVYEGAQVHFPKPGVYRMDCNLGEMQTYIGEAEVRRGSGSPISVDGQHLYYFALALTVSKYTNDEDEFYDWAHNRSDLISEQNERASAEQEEAQDADAGAAGGLFGAVPSFGSPSLVSPGSASGSLLSFSYGSVASSSPALTPFFFPGDALVILAPIRSHPVGVAWPTGIGAGLHPRPIVSRWPTSTYAGLLRGGGIGSRVPVGSSTYRPLGLSVPAYRAVGVSVPAIKVPRVSSPPVGVHAAAPTVGPHVAVHR
jgi:hypothetical protein